MVHKLTIRRRKRIAVAAERAKQLTKGWEPVFKATFDTKFEPAVERVRQIVGGELSSTQYYALIAVVHDLSLAYALTATGTSKRTPRIS